MDAESAGAEEKPYGYGKPNVFVDVSYKIYLNLYIFVPVANISVNLGSFVINYIDGVCNT